MRPAPEKGRCLTEAIIAVVVSSAGLVVSITSIVIAWGAKRQARQSATLTPRTEAIDHLHKAVSDLRSSHRVKPITLQSIQAAKNHANFVFNSNARKDFDDAVQTAGRLLGQGRLLDLDVKAARALVENLQNLIARMNDDAVLR